MEYLFKEKNKFPHILDFYNNYDFWSKINHNECVYWCRDNISDHNINWRCQNYWKFRFKNREDAMAFKLRWL